MSTIDLIRNTTIDRLIGLYLECRPRLLVVTDGPLNDGGDDFGLDKFLTVLNGTTIHGMTPVVEARNRTVAFDDLSIDQYDVLFLFGFEREDQALDTEAWGSIVRFMEAGGGVFATGDHEDLGAGMSGQLPRVRAMRYWARTETPDVEDTSRLSTNLSGANRVFEFPDQSDANPQRLYANFNIPRDYPVLAPLPGFAPANERHPHPLLRMADGSALDVFPDHPHEGECRLPDDLATTFELDGEIRQEWPLAGAFPFGFPAPRHVASTMSYGNGFDYFSLVKQPLVPRAFIALAAYNGHPASVGRVVTDATWHHYVNVNFSGLAGTTAEAQIHRYWANLANWLMPAKTRKCLFPFVVVKALMTRNLAEEIRLPERGELDPDELAEIGAAVVVSMDTDPGSAGTDALADIVGALTDTSRAAKLAERQVAGGAKSTLRTGDLASLDQAAGRAALGVLGRMVVEVARRAARDELRHDDGVFDELARQSTEVARRALAQHEAELKHSLESCQLLGEALAG